MGSSRIGINSAVALCDQFICNEHVFVNNRLFTLYIGKDSTEHISHSRVTIYAPPAGDRAAEDWERIYWIGIITSTLSAKEGKSVIRPTKRVASDGYSYTKT